MNPIFEEEVTKMINDKFEGVNTEWYSGTLFIDFDHESEESEKAARSIWHFLVEKFGLERIRISKYADNYAVDFI